MMMAHVRLQSCVQWRAKSLQQRQSIESEDLAAGAPAEQCPAPTEGSLSQEARAMCRAKCEGRACHHSSASALGVVDETAEMSFCKLRCSVTEAHLETVMHTMD